MSPSKPDKPAATLWLDTEFNGFGGALISMALVDEAGASVYFALPCDDPVPWAAEHVMPVLDIAPTTRRAAQASVRMFLHRFARANIVANWPEDIKHFCAFMVDGPADCLVTPPLAFELRTDLGGTADRSSVPHSALQDAVALRAIHMEGRKPI
jgi:hypothetical protein